MADNVHLPITVILDTEKMVRRFREYAKDMGKPAELPDDMIDELFACFKWRDRAELRLDELVAEIVCGDYKYPLGSYVDIGVASFLLELGEYVLDLLDYHRLYDRDDKLQYRPILTQESGLNAIVLRRIGEPIPKFRVTNIPSNRLPSWEERRKVSRRSGFRYPTGD